VDEVLKEQEVLVKGLGKQLSRVRNIAGATVLGSGKVVPILLDIRTSQASCSVSGPKAEAGRQLPSIRNLEKMGHHPLENNFRTPPAFSALRVSISINIPGALFLTDFPKFF